MTKIERRSDQGKAPRLGEKAEILAQQLEPCVITVGLRQHPMVDLRIAI